MLSSIGVERRDTMPSPVLNACGVLDANGAGEDYLQNTASVGGYSYTIIRPGQLFGGPHDNKCVRHADWGLLSLFPLQL